MRTSGNSEIVKVILKPFSFNGKYNLAKLSTVLAKEPKYRYKQINDFYIKII